jgi:uncharacterized protein
MAYFDIGVPTPEPTIDDQPFWAFCAQRQLRFQRCAECGRFRHPPTPGCARCHSFAHDWIEARDEAVLFSYTVVHYAAHPAVSAVLPYNVAIVLFASFDNVRLVSNLLDVAPADMRIGTALDLCWDPIEGGMFLPRFRTKPATHGKVSGESAS